jgi:hypothetical protein
MKKPEVENLVTQYLYLEKKVSDQLNLAAFIEKKFAIPLI